jgi:hypothetical protein
VKVRLARKKDRARPKDKRDAPADEQPFATLVIIVAEPQNGK